VRRSSQKSVLAWPCGLTGCALDALGVGEHVRSRAVLEGQAGIRDAAGRWLSRTDTAELERRYGATAMIRRADLLAVLCAAVPGESLRPGVTVSGFGPMDRWCTRAVSPELTWSSVRTGAQRGAPVGVAWHPRATVRRYAAWRVVTPAVPVGESCESWGAGERFGYAPLPDGRVYCYAAANAPEGASDGGLAGLRRRFGG
jgi:hypothetical protein